MNTKRPYVYSFSKYFNIEERVEEVLSRNEDAYYGGT